MQLSTKVLNYIIIFKDGAERWIDEVIYQQLLNLEEGDKFTVEGNLYDYNAISKILTAEEYYQEYPENKPPVYTEKEFIQPVKKVKKEHILECIIKGLKRYINSPQYQGTDAPLILLEKYEDRLNKYKVVIRTD